jgi:hypothetical protein
MSSCITVARIFKLNRCFAQLDLASPKKSRPLPGTDAMICDVFSPIKSAKKCETVREKLGEKICEKICQKKFCRNKLVKKLAKKWRFD